MYFSYGAALIREEINYLIIFSIAIQYGRVIREVLISIDNLIGSVRANYALA